VYCDAALCTTPDQLAFVHPQLSAVSNKDGRAAQFRQIAEQIAPAQVEPTAELEV
jgi:hypothetical protein